MSDKINNNFVWILCIFLLIGFCWDKYKDEGYFVGRVTSANTPVTSDDLYEALRKQRESWEKLEGSVNGEDVCVIFMNEGDKELAERILSYDIEVKNIWEELNILRESELHRLDRSREILDKDCVGYTDIYLSEVMGFKGMREGISVYNEALSKQYLYKEKRKRMRGLAESVIRQYEACLLELEAKKKFKLLNLDKIYSNDEDYIREIGGIEMVFSWSLEIADLLEKSRGKGNRRSEAYKLYSRLPYYLKIQVGEVGDNFSLKVPDSGFRSFFDNRVRAKYSCRYFTNIREMRSCSAEYEVKRKPGMIVFLSVDYIDGEIQFKEMFMLRGDNILKD